MPSVPGGIPIALGLVNINSAGTPESILQNFTDVDTPAKRVTATWRGKVSAVTFKSKATNTGFIFVGDATLDKGTGTGVYADIPVGGSITVQSHDSGNLFNLADFFIDADNSDDKVYVSAIKT